MRLYLQVQVLLLLFIIFAKNFTFTSKILDRNSLKHFHSRLLYIFFRMAQVGENDNILSLIKQHEQPMKLVMFYYLLILIIGLMCIFIYKKM